MYFSLFQFHCPTWIHIAIEHKFNSICLELINDCFQTFTINNSMWYMEIVGKVAPLWTNITHLWSYRSCQLLLSFLVLTSLKIQTNFLEKPFHPQTGIVFKLDTPFFWCCNTVIYKKYIFVHSNDQYIIFAYSLPIRLLAHSSQNSWNFLSDKNKGSVSYNMWSLVLHS